MWALVATCKASTSTTRGHLLQNLQNGFRQLGSKLPSLKKCCITNALYVSEDDIL
jgi:hypothetical protein